MLQDSTLTNGELRLESQGERNPILSLGHPHMVDTRTKTNGVLQCTLSVWDLANIQWKESGGPNIENDI